MNLRIRQIIRFFLSPETRPLGNNRGIAFLFAFLGALALWLIVTLNEEYETSLRYTVQLPEDGKVGSEEAPSIRIDARGSGVDLLLAHLRSRKDTLRFDFSEEELREGYILVSRHEDQVKNNLGGLSIYRLKPEKLYFDYLKNSTKKVALEFNTSLNLPPAYQLEGKAILSQDSVLIRGPKEMLDTILVWKTAGRIEAEISDKSKFSVPVLDTLDEINVLPKTVEVELTPVKYTEIKLRIPLLFTQVPPGIFVRSSHNYVDYICLVPMDEYKDIEDLAKRLTIEVPFSSLNENSPGFVPQAQLPQSLKLIRQVPLEVSYILVYDVVS